MTAPTGGTAGDSKPAGGELTPVDGAGQPDRGIRKGMFGVEGSGDTSGFGGLLRHSGERPGSAPRPYGGYHDEVADALAEALAGAGTDDVATAATNAFDETVTRVIVDRGELTLHIKPERIADVCKLLRDDPALRFELCSSVSGVDYLDIPDGAERDGEPSRLHVVYHLTSMTFRRRIRLEVSTSVGNPHVPSVTSVYPTADWQERETYDMFGVIFDGHPGLTRILMPDDWDGHPQRKDYPLGGVPVEYKGAEIPPPDTRRAYR
jgi:NADH-quinone oxidoreductase subunit C